MDDETSGAMHDHRADIAVVGGGLAGLTAAAYAAGAGASVVVVDARRTLGGRARTTVDDGFRFNEGPHALYLAGAGHDAVQALGIRPAGARPPLATSTISLGGRLRRTPPARATAEVVRLVRTLSRDSSDPAWVDASAAQWIDERVRSEEGRALAAALVRVTSYCGRLDRFSADAAIAQMRAGLRGVSYLHGGWAQLVAALERTARDAGATFVHAKAVALDGDGDEWIVGTSDATTGDRRRVVARNVVMAAGGPGAAAELAGAHAPSLAGAERHAVPVHAACLDLGLARLPRRDRQFALGIDRPTYASVHSAHAHLAERGHVLHVMHYEPDPGIGVAELDAVAEELQPDFGSHERARQIGLRRVVAFDRPRPGAGLAGRPGPVVPDADGLFVAGDWVGPDDLLAGAALASGRAAGTAAAQRAATAERLQRA